MATAAPTTPHPAPHMGRDTGPSSQTWLGLMSRKLSVTLMAFISRLICMGVWELPVARSTEANR